MKTEMNVWENSRTDQWKPETQLRVFTCLRIHTYFAEAFTRVQYEGTENMFYFFYKTKKKKTDKACIYTITKFFQETVNSHSLETINHIAYAYLSLIYAPN